MFNLAQSKIYAMHETKTAFLSHKKMDLSSSAPEEDTHEQTYLS